MTIGIEAERANNPTKTGVEHYAKQLILHLAEIDRVNNYVLYLRTKPEDWFLSLPKNFSLKVIPFPVFWTQARISWEMIFHPVDVLFIPASALPIIHPRRSVVTIHDLAWFLFPAHETWFNRNFLRFSSWFATKFAYKIIAVSQATKKDLVRLYRLDEKKIFVIHHGFSLEGVVQDRGPFDIGQGYLEPHRLGGLPKIEAGHRPALQHPYILFLSTLQPRKNLEGLISAFRQLKQELPELPHKLVVVGRPGWKFDSILQAIENNKDIVVYLNHVNESDKSSILTHADALVVPSFYEGFGMQILEAFAANVPVAASNISSMPEVAGEAAVYFDPQDNSQIKNALKNILMDKSLADGLREKGEERLKEFSWEKCAQQTLEVLEST